MVNVVSALKPLIHGLVKLAGLTCETVEIEPGTVMKFWVPKQTRRKNPTQKRDKPKKPVIVFAHPFIEDAMLMWFPQVLALTPQYAVYVPNFLFFGGSATSRADRLPEFQAECLARGLRKLGVEKCTVVGLSYGGIVGFKMAAMYPELVETMVVRDGNGSGLDRTRLPSLMVVSSAVIELTESISIQSLKKIGVSRWSEFLLPERAKDFKLLFSVGTHKLPWLPDFVYKDCVEVLFGNRKEKTELLEALVVRDEDSTNFTNYPQRIHFLWGDDDKIFDLDLARTMKEKIGERATVQWIKNAGHLVQFERPFTYNSHLKRILSSTYTNNSQ